MPIGYLPQYERTFPALAIRLRTAAKVETAASKNPRADDELDITNGLKLGLENKGADGDTFVSTILERF